MKIRTRLLLFLLPTLLGSIALISTLLAIRWHNEMIDGFQGRLQAAARSAAALYPQNSDELERIGQELGLSTLAFIAEESGERNSYTAYAPVLDDAEQVIGRIAASGDIGSIEKKFRFDLILVLLSGGGAALLMIATLYYIANRISQPIQSLNNSALAIASGHYGDAATISGPKEIADLANTLNTMSECLLENIQRLKENALLRERMYGEYECAMLLQHLMLQKNIDECRSDAVAVKSLTLFSDSPRGLLLDFPKPDKPDHFHIHMAEAEDTGFEGMYELLTQYKPRASTPAFSGRLPDEKHTGLLFDCSTSVLHASGPHLPLFWSLDGKKFLESKEGTIQLESGDFFFLFNRGLLHFLKEERKVVQDLLAKVLKVFAQDGLETTASMLQKELSFAAKRKDLSEDIHLLCFQILNP